jgi:V/A-type H+-transporting ATPase subunit K
MVLALTAVAVLSTWALAAEAPQAAADRGLNPGLLGLAAALCIVAGALGTAWAQSRIGAAAAGAMAERPEIGGIMVVLLALPEAIIILGFLAAFFIIARI